jgi:hypothetical protein
MDRSRAVSGGRAPDPHLPAIYPYRAHARIGGLMAYALDLEEVSRHPVSQVNQILKVPTPGFHRPTRFD